MSFLVEKACPGSPFPMLFVNRTDEALRRRATRKARRRLRGAKFRLMVLEMFFGRGNYHAPVR